MKKIIKKVAYILSIIIILPAVIIFVILKIVSKGEKPFQFFSQTFSIIPGIVGEYLRKAFYKFTINKCPEDCCISFGTVFSTSKVSIGHGVYIGLYCTFGNVTVGENALIGSNVDIISGRRQHRFEKLDLPIREQRGEFCEVRIGEDTWIGNSAVVLENIGKGCVIGAGSVVINPIDDLSVAVGNPANVIKKRT